MKLIGRIIAILALALVVIGILLAFASSSSASSTSGAMPERPAAAEVSATTAGAGNAPARSHEEASGFSLFGAVEVLKNLVVVGVIVALVANAKRLLGRKRRPAAHPRPRPLPPTAGSLS
jgi:hypothetical protein